MFCCFFCRLQIFENYFFFKSFMNTIRVSNKLDPDRFIGSDLSPNFLQML